MHLNAAEHPTAKWTARQLCEDSYGTKGTFKTLLKVGSDFSLPSLVAVSSRTRRVMSVRSPVADSADPKPLVDAGSNHLSIAASNSRYLAAVAHYVDV